MFRFLLFSGGLMLLALATGGLSKDADLDFIIDRS